METMIRRMVEIERLYGAGVDMTVDDIRHTTFGHRMGCPTWNHTRIQLNTLAEEGIIEKRSRNVFALYPDSRAREKRYIQRTVTAKYHKGRPDTVSDPVRPVRNQ